MVIEEFGPRVANVWNHSGTTTRNLVENAWRSAGSGSAPQVPRSAPYDPRAESGTGPNCWRPSTITRNKTEISAGREGARESRRLADACANVLSPTDAVGGSFRSVNRRRAINDIITRKSMLWPNCCRNDSPPANSASWRGATMSL